MRAPGTAVFFGCGSFAPSLLKNSAAPDADILFFKLLAELES